MTKFLADVSFGIFLFTLLICLSFIIIFTTIYILCNLIIKIMVVINKIDFSKIKGKININKVKKINKK
jgi:hypothetical protein